MTVKEKSSGVVYEVYDIKYDKAGYPHFLIYKEGQWLMKSAKYFKSSTITLGGENIDDRQ